jgi:hypothetical protein
LPPKFNAASRHKFEKKRYRVTNWASYNESLRQRGDLTVWIDTDALKLWTAPRRISRGGQPKYSDLAITICLTLGMVYGLPLRQTQGLMRSLAQLMGLEIPVPDFSTLSRRGQGLSLPAKPRPGRDEPVHLTIDSTGLKIFGEVSGCKTSINQEPNANHGASYISAWGVVTLAFASTSAGILVFSGEGSSNVQRFQSMIKTRCLELRFLPLPVRDIG